MQQRRALCVRRTFIAMLGIAMGCAVAAPARAAEVQAFGQVAAEGAYDGNISGRGDVSQSPWNAVYTKGSADWHGGIVAGGGFDVDLTDRLSTLLVVDLAGQRYWNYPVFSGFSALGAFEASAVDLPGDLDAHVTYTYRDDFLGDRGHDVYATLEKPLPFAVVGSLDAGYDWTITLDPTLANQGPFADFGASRAFRSTGTTLYAGLSGLLQGYPASRRDLTLGVSGGVSQHVGHGVSVFVRGRYNWVLSTAAGRSLASPEALAGTAWVF